ncbi:MAG: tRNA (adenosine(37)-N6)-dimethylallyltransferase MiaA [Candidatus Gracilibacteria bacterium]|nr:tRNA (adenosine(37)-N6)-dimethylallyltransferase MiaA [Candidatus Gracilibacteria bacterium]
MNYNQKLKDFLNKKSDLQKIIVIYGPTACGKTGFGIEIAKSINSQIISTDSRQIYKYLNIGTGKATLEEMSGIKHYMMDIINPDENYSVGEFKKQAENIILKMQKNGKIPILVGGTGLYIDSLIYDFNIPEVPADIELRKNLELEAQKYGNDFIYDKLLEIDRDYALELHPNNLNYIIRALEVKILTGKSKKDFRSEKKLKYETLFLTPFNGDREALYNKINLRVSKMFDDGLIDEIKNILNMGYTKTDFGFKTIGYKEVLDYLDGQISLEKCINLVKQFNRNYAKRQLTWFGKYKQN